MADFKYRDLLFLWQDETRSASLRRQFTAEDLRRDHHVRLHQLDARQVRCVALRPDAEGTVLPGSGHAPFLSDPRGFSDFLLRGCLRVA